MSTPRALLRSSRLLTRSCTTSRATRLACLSSRIVVPSRKLATSSRLQQEVVDTPSRGQEVPLTSFTPTPSGSHARSIALLEVPKRAAPSEIKAFFESKGFDITKMQIRLDRFTFHNNHYCFIELASEQQAQNAVVTLQGSEFMHSNLKVEPLKEDFVWGTTSKKSLLRSFPFGEVSPSEILRPLFEERRKMLCVQTPGWGKKNSSEGHNELAAGIIEKHLGQYGIESVSGLQPFYGDLTEEPRMLCFIDFETKSGADRAVQDFHDKEMEGRRVTLVKSILSPWRAHQIGKIDSALLAELQEKGLASKEPCEDKFVNSDKVRGAKYFKKTRVQRKNMIKTEKVGAEKAGVAA